MIHAHQFKTVIIARRANQTDPEALAQIKDLIRSNQIKIVDVKRSPEHISIVYRIIS